MYTDHTKSYTNTYNKMTVTLPHNFTPRSYQIPVLRALDNGIKRVVWCAHRRCGKDVTIFNWCVKQLYKEVATCFYVMPAYSQAKKVIWDAINNDGQRILDYIPNEIIAQKNQQEMKIRFSNGSMLQLIGSENIDSLMGTNPKIVVFSEYALQDPAAWDFIRPILKINKGVAIFISTPRGKNHFWDLFRTAQTTEGWFAQKLTIEDTGVLTRLEYEKELEENMSEELALQEYYCSFDRGVEGSCYSKLIYKMKGEERICPLAYDPSKIVHTAWDIGWNDPSALLFFQFDGNFINIIDCESKTTTILSEWKSIIDKRGYNYGTNLFPHDVENIDGLGSGCTRKEILEDLNVPVSVVDKALIGEGIESVKRLLNSRIRIDSKKCEPLLKALEFYHYEWDEKHKVYSSKPRHDWSSHYADALRYLAVGLPKVQSANASLETDYKALKAYWG